uniref:Putative secreted peptide n=1 Tax=Anopheles braziliensis TaxID=58242 RepID=A0A2M3ZU25_9DIPT
MDQSFLSGVDCVFLLLVWKWLHSQRCCFTSVQYFSASGARPWGNSIESYRIRAGKDVLERNVLDPAQFRV